MSAERKRVKNAEEDDRRMRKYVLRYNARSEQKVRVCDEQGVFHSLEAFFVPCYAHFSPVTRNISSWDIKYSNYVVFPVSLVDMCINR